MRLMLLWYIVMFIIFVRKVNCALMVHIEAAGSKSTFYDSSLTNRTHFALSQIV